MKNKDTPEEIAEKRYPNDGSYIVMDVDISDWLQLAFTNGYKLAQEQDKNKFSEEDMKSFGDWCRNGLLNTEYSVDRLDKHLQQWEQFKK